MFYLFFSLFVLITLGAYFILKYCFKFNKEKFDNIIKLILKITVIVYCSLSFLTIILPDALSLCYDQEILNVLDGEYAGPAILRWLGTLAFIMLPLAIFFKNRIIRNIAIYFCTLMTVISVAFYPTLIEFLTSTTGKGLNSMSIVSEGVKEFLINPVFRSFILGLIWGLELMIPIVLAVQEKHIFNVKSLKEWGYTVLVLIVSILSCMPIYVPQHLFGYSKIIFDAWSIPHILWILFVIAEIIVLYFIFRNKDNEIKRIMLFVLSLSLILQYNQMFGAISIDFERLPFQLCNIGSYLILFALITKSKKLFDFTVIVNVVGVIIALAMPDLDGEGLFYLYNMHFILEHTNVIVVPILALVLGVFPRLDNKTIKHVLIGFSIYFLSVLLLGTIFNGIAVHTGNDIYEANYLFMFSKEKAMEFIEFVGPIFDITLKLGVFTLYPLMQLIIYAVFIAVCMLVYGVIRLIYFTKDKITSKFKKETK